LLAQQVSPLLAGLDGALWLFGFPIGASPNGTFQSIDEAPPVFFGRGGETPANVGVRRRGAPTTAPRSVLVLVRVLEPGLVRVGMRVRLPVVVVLVLVLDVVVIVRRVGVGVDLPVVLVLVGVGGRVRMLLGHGAPLLGFTGRAPVSWPPGSSG
jgi:hypothetical protein